MVESGTNQQIGYILRSYPRLSQTFVLNEILALEQIGVPIQIFAMTHPQEEIVQPQVKQVRAPVHYLAPDSRGSVWETVNEHTAVFWHHPAGYLRALSYAIRRREIDQGYTTSSRMACFSMAVSLAAHIDRANRHSSSPISHLHAHFAHDPTFIAQTVHQITGISYSFTAHARDLFQVPGPVLVDRIKTASAVITCCQNNLKYLLQVAPEQQPKFSMIYHGVNLQHFHPAQQPAPPAGAPLILSVGRLIEKKGFFDLLEALRQVKECAIPFQCVIYGDGPLQPVLTQWVEAHGLAGCVTFAGSRTQEQLIPVYQGAALFALTPTEPEDGDRDGVPNVLVEAMAVGLPVVSTTAAGIPELVTHGLNGLLFSPHDVSGIASGIIDLLDNENRREQFGEAARGRVCEQFDVARAAVQLKTLFSHNFSSAEIGEFTHAGRPA